MLRIRRAMALHARNFLVTAFQLKVGLGVIERGRLFPVLRCMASIAANFGLMRILVASATGKRSEVVLPARAGGGADRQHSFCGRLCPRLAAQRLVALVTRDRGVLSSEREVRPCVD